MEQSMQLLWDQIIRGGYLASEGSRFMAAATAVPKGSVGCVKGFAVTFQSQHMGTDFMNLCQTCQDQIRDTI